MIAYLDGNIVRRFLQVTAGVGSVDKGLRGGFGFLKSAETGGVEVKQKLVRAIRVFFKVNAQGIAGIQRIMIRPLIQGRYFYACA